MEELLDTDSFSKVDKVALLIVPYVYPKLAEDFVKFQDVKVDMGNSIHDDNAIFK